MKKPNKTFWITNISNRNVMLSDLNVMVPAMSSINLLDGKHYHLTESQLDKSISSGSIFFKKDKIVKRMIPPTAIKSNRIDMDSINPIPSKQRSVLEIKIIEYEELKIYNDKEDALQQEFDAVAENADTVEYDRQPLIPKNRG